MGKRYRCPYCAKLKERSDLVIHINDEHADLIPKGYTATRVAFNYINYKTIDHDGKCVVCGAKTSWDENKGRYNRLCGKKSCHDIYVKKFEDNMVRVNGVKRISQTVDGQEKMLANRKISGRYRFADGGVRTYTGSYEKETLKFLDKVMNCQSDDILTPGPSLIYKYNSEDHWYISDIYYIPYNLVIEVKDGGDNPNTRNMPEYRAKQIAKEKHIIENTKFNYLRLVDKDFSQLLSTMADLKLQLVEETDERVININENMFAAAQGMFPPQNTNDVYIVNYLKKNTFTDEPDIAASDSITFDSVFYRDADGRVKKSDKSFFEDADYTVYKISNGKSKLKGIIKNLNEFVEEGFIYESLTGHKLYTVDQIKFDPVVESVVDFYYECDTISEMVKNYIYPIKDSKLIVEDVSGNLVDLRNGNSYVRYNGSLINKNNELMKYMMDYINNRGGNKYGQ